MTKLDEIFNELFGDCFENVDKIINGFSGETEEDDGTEHSYYHAVKDEYDNGKRVSHVEKEVKDGKVLKDVNETYKIENKEDCNKKAIASDSATIEEYEKKLKESNDLLEEAEQKIKKQQTTISMYKERCEEYEKKLNKISSIFNN